MKTVQLDRLQLGATAIAVVRPEKIVPAEAPVDSDATWASAGTPLGPSCCQFVCVPAATLPMVLAAFAAARLLMATAAFAAAWAVAASIQRFG
jgi:hypothetical protein